ncbi:MAG: response regulator transcription factor [Saprospiraceae bacterium]|nr:response regulator transcription factor [Saprospiraceae bacterium]
MKIATDGSERMTFTDPKPISLFIADDHILYVDSLVIALQQQTIFPVQVLGTASNGVELLAKLKSSVPDILLLDLNMPVMNGLEVIPLIKTEYPRLRIVIVTKYNDTKFVRECLQIHNVAGYILKTSALSELLDGLAQVAKGQLFMSKSIQLYPKDVVEDVEVNLFEESFLAKYNLTRRELEILSLVAQAKSNAEIADVLFISPQTVGAHRKNIMRKLNISTTAGLVRFAIENQLG